MSSPAQKRHLEQIAIATQNYLLCKAAIERRLLEIAQVERDIEEQQRLCRIVTKLERSLRSHKEQRDKLIAMDILDQ